MTTIPPHDAPVTPPPTSGPRRPLWPRLVRWLVLGSLIVFAGVLTGITGFVALHATPAGPTFGWPFRLSGRTNVLIMGLDRTVSDRSPDIVYPVSRTDTLVAASFDPTTRRVYLLSIPRDSRVPIPGHGMDKVNAAHAYGGAPLTTRTVEDLLGVPFPYYIELHVRGLVHLIDAAGGVNIHIDKDLNYDDHWDGLHIHLKRGYRHLGGMQAMEYSRFRHDALGDIGRIRRQQQVMDALLQELRRPRIVFRADRILKVFREDITTNLTQDQLVALGLFGARLPHGALIRETLPGRFGGYDGYWLPDAVTDRAMIVRFFYGVDPALLPHTTIDVVNATSSRNALTDPLARLNALGVRVLRVTTATDAAETVLVVHRGDPRAARVVAQATGVHQIVMGDAGRGPDLTLVLARDYPGARPAPPARSATQ